MTTFSGPGSKTPAQINTDSRLGIRKGNTPANAFHAPTGQLSGVMRAGSAVVLTHDGLRDALACVVLAIRQRRLAGLSTDAYEHLARELDAARSLAGQMAVHETPESHAVSVERPTVSIDEAADRMNISRRQARRLAPRLGGQIISGRWFVDEVALREHIAGKEHRHYD